jgi:hypothetical protein
MSLVQLRDGSWMAAYVVTNSSPQQVEISRSTNDMQSWQRIQTIMATDSSVLGAPQLAQSPSVRRGGCSMGWDHQGAATF